MKYFENLGSSFMSHYARRLADLINEQAAVVLEDLELSIPASAVSTVQFIHQNEGVTVALIAESLGVTHQMATQRINSLEKLSLVKRVLLPNDQRAKQVILSGKGLHEIRTLQPFMKKMKSVFQQFESELGVELSKYIYQAELSLREMSLNDRYKAIDNRDKHGDK